MNHAEALSAGGRVLRGTISALKNGSGHIIIYDPVRIDVQNYVDNCTTEQLFALLDFIKEQAT